MFLFLLQGPSPMAEVMLWQGRTTVLSVLCEQVQQPAVDKILKVMSKTDLAIIKTMKETVDELNKYRSLCEDNLQLLGTMEMYFMVSCNCLFSM